MHFNKGTSIEILEEKKEGKYVKASSNIRKHCILAFISKVKIGKLILNEKEKKLKVSTNHSKTLESWC